MSQELEKTFRKYAVYGITKATGNEMTGKNFSKLCKECNIQENGCTSTDVDIIFAKIKGKAAHVITYEEFQKGLELLSAKRFQGKPANEAIAAIHKLVEGKEPANMQTTDGHPDNYYPDVHLSSAFTHNGLFVMMGKKKNGTIMKAVTAGAVDRLTDTSKYTGSHKERFDESGKGKGLAGREELTDGCGYVGAYKGEGTYDKKSKK